MTFVLRMAVREIRASWRRLLFFFVCIAVGVAAIVAIRAVVQNVRSGLTRETQALTGADVVISGNNPFGPGVRAAVAREQAANRVTLVSESVEVATMVRAAASTQPLARMVELRAVEASYPIYGTLTLAGGARYSHELLRGHGVLVRPELMSQLGLQLGDRIVIGAQPFEIRGVVDKEPGRNVGSFSLGSRVFVDHDDLRSTGLLSFGSRANYRLMLKVAGPEREPTRLAQAFRDELVNEFVQVRSYKQVENNIGDDLQRAENYLSLVGLVVLILGGIGVSSVTRVFVQQKVRSIAILKCVGATSRDVLAIYLTQVCVLGLAGSLLGVALADAVVRAVPLLVPRVVALLPPDYGLTIGPALQGMAIGLLVSLLFSIVPLLEVRSVKPSRLLRQEAPPPAGIDWLRWTTAVGVAAALVAVAAWQAGSLRVGLMLSAGFVAVALVLHGAGTVLIRAVQPLRYTKSFALRHAVLRVGRPGNQTRVVLLAVGLGTFFVLGVRGLQANLLETFSVQLGEQAPDMFMLDIQSGQRDALTDLIDRANGPGPAPLLIPVLRARIVGAKGRDVDLEDYGEVRGRGGLAREFTVTYRAALNDNEKLVEGQWWDATPATGGAEVSIEKEIQERLKVHIGDEVRFNVVGQVIAARVTSVRTVDFRDTRAGGFIFVFRPGTFEQAPHTYIAAVKGPSDDAARARMQGLIAASYPNVSVIDLRDVLATVEEIVGNVSLAVTVVGALVLFSGALILVGAVSMTKFRRVYEAAILKTLGATSRHIAAMLLLEYGVLGVIAGSIGALGAVALSWVIARYVLDLAWTPAPALTLTGIAVTAVFVAAVGVLASLDVLRQRPIATLRAE